MKDLILKIYSRLVDHARILPHTVLDSLVIKVQTNMWNLQIMLSEQNSLWCLEALMLTHSSVNQPQNPSLKKSLIISRPAICGWAKLHMETSSNNLTLKIMPKKIKFTRSSSWTQITGINMVLLSFILETTYKHSFLGISPSICPSKIILESKAKGLLNSSKEKFAENTDFKSLNPAFHAISTSKHFYVWFPSDNNIFIVIHHIIDKFTIFFMYSRLIE